MPGTYILGYHLLYTHVRVLYVLYCSYSISIFPHHITTRSFKDRYMTVLLTYCSRSFLPQVGGRGVSSLLHCKELCPFVVLLTINSKSLLLIVTLSPVMVVRKLTNLPTTTCIFDRRLRFIHRFGLWTRRLRNLEWHLSYGWWLTSAAAEDRFNRQLFLEGPGC